MAGYDTRTSEIYRCFRTPVFSHIPGFVIRRHLREKWAKTLREFSSTSQSEIPRWRELARVTCRGTFTSLKQWRDAPNRKSRQFKITRYSLGMETAHDLARRYGIRCLSCCELWNWHERSDDSGGLYASDLYRRMVVFWDRGEVSPPLLCIECDRKELFLKKESFQKTEKALFLLKKCIKNRASPAPNMELTE